MQQDPRKDKMRSFSRSDIRELAEHFGQFGSEQMIGIGNDLTPHYLARCPIIYIWSSLIIAILVVGLFRLKSILVLMLLFKNTVLISNQLLITWCHQSQSRQYSARKASAREIPHLKLGQLVVSRSRRSKYTIDDILLILI